MLSVGVCLGQGRDTIYQNLATNITTDPGLLTVTNNIGQSYHNFAVSYGPKTGGGTACSVSMPYFAYIYGGVIEASYNNVVWFSIPGQRVTSSGDTTTNDTQVKLYRAAGAFPYVRFRTYYFPHHIATGCSINISYTGSLTSVPILDTQQKYSLNVIGVTTACTAAFHVVVDPEQNNVFGAPTPVFNGFNIVTDATSTNPVTIGFFRDSSCTNGIVSLSFFGNSVLQPDTLQSYWAFTGTVAANGDEGMWVKQTSAGTTTTNLFTYASEVN